MFFELLCVIIYQRIYKPFVRLFLRQKCEIYRVCNTTQSRQSVIRPAFETSLLRSRQLKDVAGEIVNQGREGEGERKGRLAEESDKEANKRKRERSSGSGGVDVDWLVSLTGRLLEVKNIRYEISFLRQSMEGCVDSRGVSESCPGGLDKGKSGGRRKTGGGRKSEEKESLLSESDGSPGSSSSCGGRRTSGMNELVVSNAAFCMKEISRVAELRRGIDAARKVKYEETNAVHERGLLLLWGLLQPHCKLESRTGKTWQLLGFQGDNPATDFRGMGLLGLYNLLYFATFYTDICTSVLSNANHPYRGYSFAVVGINITALLFNLLCADTSEKKNRECVVVRKKPYLLKSHFYNSVSDAATLGERHKEAQKKFGRLKGVCGEGDSNASKEESGRKVKGSDGDDPAVDSRLMEELLEHADFHELYCFIFYEFNKLWVAEEPENMMAFNRIIGLFEDKLVKSLNEGGEGFSFKLLSDIILPS
eukprot:Nk52_evm3s400 gene=Nk52_evmTU3s400